LLLGHFSSSKAAIWLYKFWLSERLFRAIFCHFGAKFLKAKHGELCGKFAIFGA
jgi:hypothetical protein